MKQLDQTLLETAKRRTIHASVEARLLKVEVRKVQDAIQRLRKAKLIFRSEPAQRAYWGSTDAGYRAVPTGFKSVTIIQHD